MIGSILIRSEKKHGGVREGRTAPQEPQALAAPSEAAPHLGQLDPCMLDLFGLVWFGGGVFVAVRELRLWFGGWVESCLSV